MTTTNPIKAPSIIALMSLILLGGCASAMQPTAINVAPYPRTYTCAEIRNLGDKYDSLPDIVRKMLDDYSVERQALAKAHGMRLQCHRS
jgi:hypothetical protein